MFDKEGNGYLSLEQLKRALTTYGEAFTDNEAEEFFKWDNFTINCTLSLLSSIRYYFSVWVLPGDIIICPIEVIVNGR